MRLLKHLLLTVFVVSFSSFTLAKKVHQAQTLNEQAITQHQQGHYQQAAKLYQQALPLVQEHFGENSIEVARIMASIADTQSARSDYKQSAETYQQVLNMLEQHNAPLDKVDALNGLASSFYMRRHFRKAEPIFLTALALIDKQKETPKERLFIVLDNITALYLSMGNRYKADSYRRRATTSKNSSK